MAPTRSLIPCSLSSRQSNIPRYGMATLIPSARSPAKEHSPWKVHCHTSDGIKFDITSSMTQIIIIIKPTRRTICVNIRMCQKNGHKFHIHFEIRFKFYQYDHDVSCLIINASEITNKSIKIFYGKREDTFANSSISQYKAWIPKVRIALNTKIWE